MSGFVWKCTVIHALGVHGQVSQTEEEVCVCMCAFMRVWWGAESLSQGDVGGDVHIE